MGNFNFYYMRSFFALVALLFTLNSFGQILNPVKWTWKAVPAGKDEYKLQFTAIIDKGWHTYSQFQGNDGAVPTSFHYETNKNVTLVGKSTETCAKAHEGIDDVFGVFQKSFEEKVVFEQLVKVTGTTTYKGTFEYMVCDNKTCLPPTTVSFSFDLTSTQSGVEIKKKIIDTVGQVVVAEIDTTVTSPIKNVASALTAYYRHFFDKNKFGSPLSDCTGEKQELNMPENKSADTGVWLAFVLGFAGGLLALLTPCVFPMIPLTVSFFTKRNESKTRGRFESVFYGFSIFFIYFLFAMIFWFFNFSPNLLNEIATNLWVNLAFFVIFIVFAFSFFGYYEIGLPNSWANKVDSASNLGGLVGIFFMAMTLVVVSFSCTGPILGTLLGSMAASPNGKLNLVVGMSAFGLAMSLPFTLFAFFPSLMKSLPKSGSWMDALKVVFGFVELILGLKFLSNADLAGHWGLLKREPFLLIWVLLGLAVVLYLLGVLKMKGNENINRKSPIRLFFVAVFAWFTLYSAYGLMGNNLPLFSGFIPPNYYSIFKKEAHCPNDMNCFNDYDEGLAYAKQQNKPVLIDFTGFNCANCRRMEETVWVDSAVAKLINEQYVLVSLHVDDYQNKLPDSLQYISPFNGEKRTSYGHKWSDLQTVCFNTNTQPQYVLISPDEKLLNTPWNGYDADVKKYQAFLECGLVANKLKEVHTK